MLCDKLPLLKLLLHAAKYPAATINGLLLGSVQGEEVHVKDAVPLFHTSTNLAMPTEVALAMVEAQTQQPGSSNKMVGYYHSEARLQAADLTPVGRKVADKATAKQPAAVVILLDSRKLEPFLKGDSSTQHPFEVFVKSGGSAWKREQPEKLSLAEGSWTSLHADFVSLYKAHAQLSLVDFDNHLDDISKDYMNPQLQGAGR